MTTAPGESCAYGFSPFSTETTGTMVQDRATSRWLNLIVSDVPDDNTIPFNQEYFSFNNGTTPSLLQSTTTVPLASILQGGLHVASPTSPVSISAEDAWRSAENISLSAVEQGLFRHFVEELACWVCGEFHSISFSLDA